MSTDWNLIREILSSAVDACEASERLGLSEAERGNSTSRPGVTVFDVLTSAWTYPESLQYEVIRMRHELGSDSPYRDTAARVLREVGALCAELVKAPVDRPVHRERTGQPITIRAEAERLCAWYSEVMTPLLASAAAQGSQ